ncbi:histidine N-alpha-methyltransferase-like [Pecten maximus]|uniref:histidine N-alpha-methyltransferase-like n=1 Tax=Pecten maximus TaxID=6579 RepID=UPI0014590186|nr:histidine N-alpha-methyltransferase-like [Pecten maximus]
MADNLKRILVSGLTSNPKYIPTWYNYDEVGSRLLQKSVEINRDYYLRGSEKEFLEHRSQDIIPDVSYDLTLVDLGSGDCSKTRHVIDELLKRQKALTFYPLDISAEFLLDAAKEISQEYDELLLVRPITADYVEGINQLSRSRLRSGMR